MFLAWGSLLSFCAPLVYGGPEEDGMDKRELVRSQSGVARTQRRIVQREDKNALKEEGMR